MGKPRTAQLNPTQIQLHLSMRAGLDLRRRDPMKFFRWASAAQSKIAKYLALGLEVLARFGNSAGKTHGASHIVVAICRGIEMLDGQRLPKLRQPVVAWVLTKTRRQQVDAAQAAYLEAIGDWPHEIAWDNRAKHYIDSIWIATRWCQHRGGTHCSHCSRLVFHCEQSGVETMLGGRVDIIHADEPPSEKIWREARSRIRAGARLLLLITATPLYRRDWDWMARDFQHVQDAPRAGRVEIRSNLDENRFLPAATREQLIQNWANDVLFDARRWGDYVDAAGLCPFAAALLKRVEGQCREPLEVKRVKIEMERESSSGLVLEHRQVQVQMWWHREPSETYWVLCDPSTGVEDEKHDPAGIHVYARRRRRLVARYDGYCGAHGLGILAAKLARYYNLAWVDVETNGGYGRGTLAALTRRAKYTQINYRQVEAEPGKYRDVLGWETTHSLRGEMTAGVQRELEEGSIVIPSREVLSTLRNITVDNTGKYLAAPGRHDEDFILLGRNAVLSQFRPEAPLVEVAHRPSMARALEQDLKRKVLHQEEDESGRPLRRGR